MPIRLAWKIQRRQYPEPGCPERWGNNSTHEDLNAVSEDGSLKYSKREHYATVEFVAFLQDKLNTQTQKVGNTAEFFQKEATVAKSAMLIGIHPDVAKAADMFKTTTKLSMRYSEITGSSGSMRASRNSRQRNGSLRRTRIHMEFGL